jgi:hypothetical protein
MYAVESTSSYHWEMVVESSRPEKTQLLHAVKELTEEFPLKSEVKVSRVDASEHHEIGRHEQLSTAVPLHWKLTQFS